MPTPFPLDLTRDSGQRELSYAVAIALASEAVWAPRCVEPVRVVSYAITPIGYSAQSPNSAGLWRVRGKAVRSSRETSPWSLVVKALRPEPAHVSPSHPEYWAREEFVYRSGILDSLPAGFATPRCYGTSAGESGERLLWLEDVDGQPGAAWPLARYGLAARHLGQFNGTLQATALDQRWLNHSWRATWDGKPHLTLHRLRALPQCGQDALRVAFPNPEWLYARLRWLKRVNRELHAVVETQPLVLCHLDAYSRNLLARPLPGGGSEMVALDWALAGVGVVGDDLAQLVAGTLLFGDVPMDKANALLEVASAGYLAGLRAAGWEGDDARVRRNAAASMALRWTDAVVRLVCSVAEAPAGDERWCVTWGASCVELLARWGALARFLFTWGEAALA